MPTKHPLPREPESDLWAGSFKMLLVDAAELVYYRFLLNSRDTIVVDLQCASFFTPEVVVIDDCLSEPVETRLVIPVPIFQCVRRDRDQLVFLGSSVFFNYTISTKTLDNALSHGLLSYDWCLRVSVYEDTLAIIFSFLNRKELQVLDLDSGATRLVTLPPKFHQGYIETLNDGSLGFVMSHLVGHVHFD